MRQIQTVALQQYLLKMVPCITLRIQKVPVIKKFPRTSLKIEKSSDQHKTTYQHKSVAWCPDVDTVVRRPALTLEAYYSVDSYTVLLEVR